MKALLKSREAAEYIGYSDVAIRRSRFTKTLGGIEAPIYLKIGRTVRYEVAELDKWIAAISKSEVIKEG